MTNEVRKKDEEQKLRRESENDCSGLIMTERWANVKFQLWILINEYNYKNRMHHMDVWGFIF